MTPAPDLTGAVTAALRAPSVHNTQPWRWRLRPGVAELYADPLRRLDATDPDGRDMVLSCGAALHHLQVALAAAGHAADVDRLPDPENRDHLATVTVRPGRPNPAVAALGPAIDRRRTERRRMSHTPLTPAQTAALIAGAGPGPVQLVPIDAAGALRLLATTLDDAARRQESVPGYAAELRMWTGRYAAARDGIPAGARADTPLGLVGTTPLRHFPHGTLRQPPDPAGPRTPDDAAILFVLTTTEDGVLDRLRAGEALGAVLLTATRLGLATTPLSQCTEVAAAREDLRRRVLHIPEHPQILLRIGRPAAHADDLPRTPRRDLHTVLLPG